jgi:tetratricopeptide (TPR) repeat protein
MKIFLSYGRDEYVAEARALRDALQARGHEVWFDEGRLKGGRDWENQIEQGIRDCDRVVLTMTPYSVRRPDGYCLNELAKAMELQKTIIPVLLAPVPDGAPTSICRIQYLDWRDAVPATEQQERFSARLSRLCEAIEHDRLDFEGGQQRLKRHLRPLDFASDMQRHIARFQGRAGLFARIRAWLADPSSSQIFWLSGPPGVGKSAIAAEISHRWEEGAAHHFCVAGHQDKSDPAKAVLSIAYQLSQRLDLYAVRLSNLELEQEAVKDAKTLFDNLLVGQLSRDFPAPPKPCLVVIDALDEATAPDGRNALAELIALDWRRLPPWIRLLITGRPEVEVQGWLGEADTLSLQGDDPEQVADLRSHVARELEAMGRPVRPETLERIVERSEGAFQYVVLLLEDIRQGRCNPDDARDLPSGMGAYYRQTFQRRFLDASTYQDRLRPLIALLLASPEPAPLAVLASASGMTVAEVRRQLSQLGSMVTVSPAETGWDTDWDTARLTHATLAKWLTAVDARTRLPSAAPYDVQGDTATLCDEVLRRWEGRTDDAPAHPFVARVLWPLLMRGDQGDAMDRVAFDLSVYWEEKSDLTRALHLAEHAARSGEVESSEGQQRRAEVLCHLSNISYAIGNSEQALATAVNAVEIAERLARRDPNNVNWLTNLRISYNRVAESYEMQGSLKTAMTEYLKAQAIAERLLRLDLTNTDWQRDLAFSYFRVGGIYKMQSNYERALIEFRKAQALAKQLAEQDPVSNEWQRYLGALHNGVGDVYKMQNKIDWAFEEYGKAQDIAERLVERDPSNAELLRGLSVSCSRMGDIQKARDNLEAALVEYRKAQVLRGRLTVLDPANAVWQRGFGHFCSRVGSIHELQGDLGTALAEYQKANSIASRLVQKDKANAEWQRDLGWTRQHIGETLRGLGSYAESRESFRAALEILESLDGRGSDGVAVVLAGLGKLEMLDGDYPAAATHFAEALDIRREVSPEDGEEIARLEQQLAAAREGRAPPPETGG